MFQRSARSRTRAISADIGEIEHRLRTLEKHLERIGGNTSRNAAQAVDRIGETADRVAETVASALSTMADRFRGKASSVSDQAGRMGNEAAKLGNDALQRLSREVEHRPLITLGRCRWRGDSHWGGEPSPLVARTNPTGRFGRQIRIVDDFRSATPDAPRPRQAVTRRSRRFAVRSKNRAWLATADTVAGWNGLAIRKAGSGRSPVRKRSG